MKMKKLFLFLLIAICAQNCKSQIFPGTVAANKGYGRNDTLRLYTDIPIAPTFLDSHTVNESTTGAAIQIGDTGGKFELLISGGYSQFQLNGLTGSYSTKSQYDTLPSSWSTIGGGALPYAITAAGANPTVYYYNLKIDEASNAIKMPVATIPQAQTYQNLIISYPTFASFLINESVLGKNYGRLTINFCRSFYSGGEFLYLGKTGLIKSFFVDSTFITNNYSIGSGREGAQCNGHKYVYIGNNTFKNCGRDLTAGLGQENVAQLQGVTGYFINNVGNAVSPMMIASTKLKVRNNYIGWTANREIYIQDMVANGYDEYKIPGDTLFIENNIFDNDDYLLNYLFRIQEEDCVLVIRNNILPASATSIIKDERTSHPYATIMSGNTFTSDPPRPVYGPSPDSGYVGFEEVIINSVIYNRGMGARTPPPPFEF